MYESEKARLKTFLNFSDEEKYDLILRSIRKVNQTCTNIFNGDSRNLAIEILRSASVWGMKCDGACSSREIIFFKNFFTRTNLNVQNWTSGSVSDAKAFLHATILAAKNNALIDRTKLKDYESLTEVLAVIFGTFATADGIISDSTGQALNEFVKMC